MSTRTAPSSLAPPTPRAAHARRISLHAQRERRTDGGLLLAMTGEGATSIKGTFLGIARRYSMCDDDAREAVARGLEIALRERDRMRPQTAAAWFATVVRHEAMHIRRSRCRELSLEAATREPAQPAPEPERDPDPRLPALRAAMRQ